MSNFKANVNTLVNKLFGTTPGDGEMQAKEGIAYNITPNTTTDSNGIATTKTKAAFIFTVNAIIIAPKTTNGERINNRSTIFTPDCN